MKQRRVRKCSGSAFPVQEGDACIKARSGGVQEGDACGQFVRIPAVVLPNSCAAAGSSRSSRAEIAFMHLLTVFASVFLAQARGVHVDVRAEDQFVRICAAAVS